MKPITIIGGGLAGLTLGIALREHSVPVRVFEAGTYPRHRVCGEFISGRGQAVLRRLNLLTPLLKAGASTAKSARFFTETRVSPSHLLPEPALCLPRYHLDTLLAEQFVRAGGELICGTRLHPDCCNEGTVRTTGRTLHPTTDGWRWYGLKAHATNVELTADLELHFFQHGYVGLCRLDEQKVNVCGLFRNRPGRIKENVPWTAKLTGQPGSLLHKRLASAVWQEETFAAVSGLRYSRPAKSNSIECALGDAFSLIAPMAGNGMSMAFESAEIALPHILNYTKRERSWTETAECINGACSKAFRRRLVVAKLLQDLVLLPRLSYRLIPAITHSTRLVAVLFNGTR